jgi:hypothetical protein|nr:MAG: hypothetical protein OI719_00315 [Candidatus Methanoperedens sp.]
MRIAWEKVKRDARDSLAHQSQGEQMRIWALIESVHNGTFDWRKSLGELQKAGESIIEGWDVRMCVGLLEVFPHIIPKKYHGVTPAVYMDDVTERWVLDYGGMQA